MKFKISLVLLSFIVISCKSKSFQENKTSLLQEQKEVNYIPYYLKVYQADSLYLIGNYERSYQILDSLFKKYEPLNTDNYAEYSNYLTSSLKSGHLDKLKDKVIYGLVNFGNVQTYHKDSYQMYLDLRENCGITRDEEDSLKAIYNSRLNVELRAMIVDMFKRDQDVRLENVNESVEKIDNENRIKINAIFKEYGFPNKKLVGSGYSSQYRFNLETLIIHQPDSVRLKYLPVFFDAVKKGYIDPEPYAAIYDRVQLDKNLHQYYGTFLCDSSGEMCLLSNPKKIDSIRYSIGLPHYKYYFWKTQQY